MPNPVGRPSSYRPEFCQMLIEHCSSGLFYSSFAGHPEVRVSIDTLYEWEKVHPEFSEAKKIAVAAYEYFLEVAGRDGTMGKIHNFNSSTWSLIRKNRSSWREKSELSGSIKLEDLVASPKIEDK